MRGSMALRMPELSEHHEAPPILSHEETVPEVQQVGYQSCIIDNLSVDSHLYTLPFHAALLVALSPYIDLS